MLPDKLRARRSFGKSTVLAPGLLAAGTFDPEDSDATAHVVGAFVRQPEGLQSGFGAADQVVESDTGQRECECKAGCKVEAP